MKIKKNINNNVSLCIDNKGRELIAFGKGIGFIKPPYEVPLDKIERTFYNIKETDLDLIASISTDVLEAAINITDSVERNLNITLMPSAALALADHIEFAIQRKRQHIVLALPVQEDIRQLYPDEVKEAYKALDIIKEYTGVRLRKDEAITIALHFISNRIEKTFDTDVNINKILKKITDIIEQTFTLRIDKESFDYSRFITHVNYLMKRVVKGAQSDSDNKEMFESMKKQYPLSYECVREINIVFLEELDRSLNDEELLYLMIHINRSCSRELVDK